MWFSQKDRQRWIYAAETAADLGRRRSTDDVIADRRKYSEAYHCCFPSYIGCAVSLVLCLTVEIEVVSLLTTSFGVLVGSLSSVKYRYTLRPDIKTVINSGKKSNSRSYITRKCNCNNYRNRNM